MSNAMNRSYRQLLATLCVLETLPRSSPEASSALDRSAPASHSPTPKTESPSSQLSSSLVSLPTHLGTEDQQGTWNPLPPSLPTCHLSIHGKGLRAGSEGPSVLHLAGGLARRGSRLGNSSQKPLALLCFGIGVSLADGK